MNTEPKILYDVLKGKSVDKTPVWLMRQAGRYLPEYKKLRKETGSFLDLCLTPEAASEVTLQPLRRFNLDGAILFADILLVPLALGQAVRFKEERGPLLDELNLQSLKWREEKISPVYETIKLVKKQLDPSTTFLGFAGGLWTVACYMIQGCSGTEWKEVLTKEKTDQAFMEELFEKLLEATLFYLKGQISSGIDVIQLFESHAGLLEGEDSFQKWIIEPTKKIVSSLKSAYPDLPVIGFPKGASLAQAERYFRETGVQALSVDHHQNIKEVKEKLGPIGVLQGNLDPNILLKGGAPMAHAVEEIKACFGPRHIFNLGHGVLPQTPPAHVEQLVSLVHGEKR